MKRVKIALAVVFVALAGVVGWKVLKPSDEPVYKGRTLTSWLADFRWARANKSSFLESNWELGEAIRQIGTNAIPTLLRLLRASDSPLKAKVMSLLARQPVFKVEYRPAEFWNESAEYGFRVLGTNAQSAIPALLGVATENISSWSRVCAILSLRDIGPPAKPLVPRLLQWATNADPDVRRVTWYALQELDPEAAAKAGITNTP